MNLRPSGRAEHTQQHRTHTKSHTGSTILTCSLGASTRLGFLDLLRPRAMQRATVVAIPVSAVPIAAAPIASASVRTVALDRHALAAPVM